jgi:hypothetical protein
VSRFPAVANVCGNAAALRSHSLTRTVSRNLASCMAGCLKSQLQTSASLASRWIMASQQPRSGQHNFRCIFYKFLVVLSYPRPSVLWGFII